MNMIPDCSIVVSEISADAFKLRISGEELITKMKALGFSCADGFMIKNVADEKEKLDLIRQLVKNGALFSFGYGWYPSEFMANYKEKGIYCGKYKVISWVDRYHYHIEEK